MTTVALGAAERSLREDFAIYVGRVREFGRREWWVYCSWVGLMLGLTSVTSAFLIFGATHGVAFPVEAWLVPIGAFAFTLAISVDTIGHLTVYREEIRQGEQLVHHVTIVAGVASCVLLCAAYSAPGWFGIPALVATVISVLYSLIDEAFHWRRYVSLHSDRIEMWSHVLILGGHATMMLAWWHWFSTGYAGVSATLQALDSP